MLSKEKEQELVLAFKAGDRAAELRLLRSFFYLIAGEARHKDFRGVPKEDLLMAGVVAFLKALPDFDPDKGKKDKRLSTFVRPRIHGAMLDEQRRWQMARTRDQRWLLSNHYKYADQQLIGGSYSAIDNPALITALVAAMAHPTTGIKGYAAERAVQAIADFEAARGHAHYDTRAEVGSSTGDDRTPELDFTDSPSWAAYAVGDIDDYRPLTNEEWLSYCLQRTNAHYTDAEWGAHIKRRGTPSGFPTHPAPLKKIGRSQYEADQASAHGVFINAIEKADEIQDPSDSSGGRRERAREGG
jgi:Sigma-70 region 2